MRNFFRIPVLMLLRSVSLFAQNKSEDEIIKLVKARATALVRGDTTFFERLIAKDFTYVASDGTVSDRGKYLKRLTSGEMSFEKQEVSNIRVRISGVTGIVTCDLHDRFTFRDTFYEADFGLFKFTLK